MRDTDPTLQPPNPLDALAERHGARWEQIFRCREDARARRRELDAALGRLTDLRDDPDTSIVVFGSLARDEVTAGSDIDWTLLVDGAADPGHLDAARRIGRHAPRRPDSDPDPGDPRKPGRSGPDS